MAWPARGRSLAACAGAARSDLCGFLRCDRFVTTWSGRQEP
jgi:hypothetical protein